jgi:predicted nucleic acid-binding protein
MISRVGVDASFIVRTLIPDSLTENALLLIATLQREHILLVAPSLLAFEVTSTLRRYVHSSVSQLRKVKEHLSSFSGSIYT